MQLYVRLQHEIECHMWFNNSFTACFRFTKRRALYRLSLSSALWVASYTFTSAFARQSRTIARANSRNERIELVCGPGRTPGVEIPNKPMVEMRTLEITT
jgi:hypothetical protein